MVTAYSRDDLMAQATDLPLLGVLEKPVTPSSVLDAIVNSYGRVDTQALAPSPRQTSYEAALQRIRGARVLLAEDNDINQELAVDILTGLGLRVDIAQNGSEAVSLASHGAFDVVLMDCQMPVMDGFQATMEIRRMPHLASLPILAMTANAMVGDRERCLEAGMNEHISKPIDVNALTAMLARWIKPPAERASADAVPDQSAIDDSALRAAGVDIKAGLARLRGNTVQYTKLLTMFRERQAGVAADVRNAIGRGEEELARRLAHNLKGLAANIGADDLYHAAARLEAAIADGGDVETRIAQLAVPLQNLLLAIDNFLNPAPS